MGLRNPEIMNREQLLNELKDLGYHRQHALDEYEDRLQQLREYEDRVYQCIRKLNDKAIDEHDNSQQFTDKRALDGEINATFG